AGCRVLIDGCSADLVELLTRLAQQRFCRVQFEFQLADVGNHVEVIAGALDIGVDPRAGFLAYKGNRIVDGAARNTRVDCGLDQLRNGALNVRRQGQAPVIDHPPGVHRHVVEQHRAAGGCALAKARPVINDAQARCAALDEGHDLPALIIQRFDCDPMREQRAGGIELLSGNGQAVAIGGDPRLEFQRVFGATLRACIADAPTVQHALEQRFLLLLGGAALQQVQNAELVLRNLSQCRVGSRNDPENFGYRDERYLRAAVRARDGNTAQSATGELFDFSPGQGALSVAIGGVDLRGRGQFMGCCNGLRVVLQHAGLQQAGGNVRLLWSLDAVGRYRRRIRLASLTVNRYDPGFIHRGSCERDHRNLVAVGRIRCGWKTSRCPVVRCIYPKRV
ncbi:hypothetical protein ALO91_102536, partial [Pseudomonas syringae pv. aceris]